MYGRLSPNKRESGQSHQKSPLAGVEACHRDHRHASTCVNTRDPDLVFYLDLQRDLCHSDSRNQSAKHLNVCEHWDLDLESGLSPHDQLPTEKTIPESSVESCPKTGFVNFTWFCVRNHWQSTQGTSGPCSRLHTCFVFEKIVSAEPTPKKTVCHH